MPLFSNLIGFFSALICLLGASAFGWHATKIIWRKHTSFHLSLVVGLAIVYLSTYIFFILPFQVLAWVLITMLLMGVVVTLPKFFQLVIHQIRSMWWFWLVIFLLLLPLFFRVLSPPTSFDGMSFYIPNVIWISQNGLSFNSHLPQYSTMPLLTEFFFALNYKLGGIQAIRFSDMFFSLLLLDVLLKIGKSFKSKLFLNLFLAINLLAPGCIIFVFGTGKVDTLGFYLAALGSYHIFSKWSPLRAFFYFSVALAVKYTLWVVLFGPLLGLGVVLLLRNRFSWPKKLVVLCLPLLFAGPVLVKNFHQVNNPLAPLLPNGKETRYVGTHGELPQSNAMEISSKALGGLSIGKTFNIQFPSLKTLSYVAFALLILLMIYFKGKSAFLRDVLFFALFLVPWLYLFGNSSQPLRFYWPIFLISFLVIIKWISELLNHRAAKNSGLLLRINVVMIWLFLGGFFWLKNGTWIPKFYKSQTLPMAEWYHKNDRNHYAISSALAEGTIPLDQIQFEERVALGFFPLKDWKHIPEPQFFLQESHTVGQPQKDFSFREQIPQNDLPPNLIIYQFGEFVLIQQQ
jgi:hypothetical protein